MLKVKIPGQDPVVLSSPTGVSFERLATEIEAAASIGRASLELSEESFESLETMTGGNFPKTLCKRVNVRLEASQEDVRVNYIALKNDQPLNFDFNFSATSRKPSS